MNGSSPAAEELNGTVKKAAKGRKRKGRGRRGMGGCMSSIRVC